MGVRTDSGKAGGRLKLLMPLFTGTTVIVLVRLLRASSQLAVMAVAAKAGGVELVGKAAQYSLFWSLISSMSLAGFGPVLVRLFASDTEPRLLILKTAIGLKVAQSVVAAFLCLMYLIITGQLAGNTVAVVLIAMVCSALSFQSLMDSYSVAQHRYAEYGIYNASGIALGVVAKIAGLTWYGIYGFLLAVLLEAALSGALALGVLRVWRWENATGVFRRAVSLINETRALVGAAVVSSVLARLDQLLVSGMLGEVALGLYSVAAKIIDLVQLATSSFATALFPTLYRHSKVGKAQFASSLTITRMLFALGAVVVFAGALLFLEPVVVLALGQEFLASIGIWYLLAIGLPLVFINDLLAKWILIQEEYKLAFSRKVLAIVGLLVIALPAVDEFGIAAICIAVVASHVMANIVAPLLFSQGKERFWQTSKFGVGYSSR